ncbi:low affinity iron permease family protein [Epilithonimonas tenax]|uniref:low affinity iron permease family protein n=2 Tax=Chryseobacterium group TaxID=2782232 RepID=UPI001377AE5C|nr:low affinity iron permease family protein [Epilithonimonas tenax]
MSHKKWFGRFGNTATLPSELPHLRSFINCYAVGDHCFGFFYYSETLRVVINACCYHYYFDCFCIQKSQNIDGNAVELKFNELIKVRKQTC